MGRIKDLLSILREKEAWASCKEIGEMLNISENAVRKNINRLRTYGYLIETKRRSGYKLMKTPDKLYPWEIEPYLTTQRIGKRVVYREVLESTNTLAFKLAKEGEKEGTCVVAEKQTEGRGRLQRSWFSPEGKNIYVSIILRPEVSFFEIYTLPFLSCLSVSDVIESVCKLKPILKWPNDVLIGEKKISGTLVEISSKREEVDFAVVGVGLNVNMEKEDLPAEIRDIATSLCIETGRKYPRTYICASLLNSFERYYMMLVNEGARAIRLLWEEKAEIKGKAITVSEGDRVLSGVCQGLDEKGALLLSTQGGTQRVYTGDLTIQKCFS